MFQVDPFQDRFRKLFYSIRYGAVVVRLNFLYKANQSLVAYFKKWIFGLR